MIGIYITETETYLTYDWLVDAGVSINSIEAWVKRKVCKTKPFKGRSCIEYSSIPAPSRKKTTLERSYP